MSASILATREASALAMAGISYLASFEVTRWETRTAVAFDYYISCLVISPVMFCFSKIIISRPMSLNSSSAILFASARATLPTDFSATFEATSLATASTVAFATLYASNLAIGVAVALAILLVSRRAICAASEVALR